MCFTSCNIDAAIKSAGRMSSGVQVLGLDHGADTAAIRRAKRNLALLTHPDKTASPGARQALERVIAAHDYLMMPRRRDKYARDVARAAQAGKGAATAAAAVPQNADGWEDMEAAGEDECFVLKTSCVAGVSSHYPVVCKSSIYAVTPRRQTWL
jgi:curved DNA-binding protein CbpA